MGNKKNKKDIENIGVEKLSSQDKKKIYVKIVENRFNISAVLFILFSIIGVLLNIQRINEWILDTSTPFSLWWNFKLFSLILATYELFSVITDKSRGYSLIGTIIVVASGCVKFNFDKVDSLIWGQLICVFIEKILKEKNIYKQGILAIGILLSTVAYSFTFEGYAIAFSYVFIALIIWIMLKNREELKNKKTVSLVFSTIVVSVISVVITRCLLPFSYNEILENEPKGISVLYSYLYNMLLPFFDFEGKEIFGSFISVFPLPMLIALYYMYKNEEHTEFLLPLTIVSVIQTVFCMSGFPDIIENIVFFSKASNSCVMAAVNLTNVYILFYIIKNIDTKMFSITTAMRVAVVLMLIVGFIAYPTVFATRGFLSLFIIEDCVLSFLFLILHDLNYKKVLLFFMLLFTLL